MVRKATRAAYSAVCYSKEGKPLWVMRGTCGEPHPSINRAELLAVLAVLKRCAGAVVIRTDSAFVVRGVEEGEGRTTASRYEAADIWREVWAVMKEIEGGRGEEGCGRVVIQKVKAHTKWKEVMEGKVPQFDHVGNEAADKAAKEALAVAKLEAPADAYNVAIATAILWAKRIMDYASIWDPRCPEKEERGEEALEMAEGERLMNGGGGAARWNTSSGKEGGW